MLNSEIFSQDSAPSKLMAALFALSLAAYPGAATIATMLEVDGRPISIAFRGLFLGLSILATCIWIMRRAPVYRSAFWVFYFGFWAMYILRLFYDLEIAQVPSAYPADTYFIFVLGVTVVPSIAFFRQLDSTTSKWAFFTSLIALMACQVGFLSSLENTIVERETERLQNEVLNAISLGAIGGVSVVMAVYALLDIFRENDDSGKRWQSSRWMVTLCFAAIALGLGTLFLSGSRGPLLSVVMCTSLLLFRTYHFTESRVGVVLLFVLLIGACAALVLPFAVEFGAPILDRLYNSFRMDEMSDVGRFLLWQNGWEQFLNSPMLGSGFEEKEAVFYPHNLPLEALMATGIVGGVFWIAMSGIGIARALRILWNQPEYGWISLVFLFLLSNSLFSGSLWNAGPVAHFMVALFAIDPRGVTARLKRRRRSSNTALRRLVRAQG